MDTEYSYNGSEDEDEEDRKSKFILYGKNRSYAQWYYQHEMFEFLQLNWSLYLNKCVMFEWYTNLRLFVYLALF